MRARPTRMLPPPGPFCGLLLPVRPLPSRPMRLAAATLALLAACAPLAASAQQAAPARAATDRYVRLDAVGVVPVGGLATRFGPAPSASVGIGWAIDGSRGLELSISGVRFPKGDVEFGPDTTGVGFGPIDADSLDLSLALVGGALRFHQRVASIGPAAVRGVIGGGFTHWVDRRGAYPSRKVPDGARRAQWSGHLSAGLGADVPLTPRVALTTDVLYHLLPADLWETQRVRLDPVRTFQFATLSLGVKVGL